MMARISPLLLVAALSFSLPALGQDLVLSHQGYLLDGQDRPVDGVREITVSLWNDPAATNEQARLWEDSFDNVTVTRGAYALALGDTQAAGHEDKPLTAEHFAGEVYLGVSVDGVHLLPRLRISTVPSALRAIEAEEAGNARKLGGVDAALYALKTDIPEKAADSARLNGQEASFYLAAAATAADAAKFGGELPEYYLAADATAADAERLGGRLPADYQLATAQAPDAAKLGGRAASDYLLAESYRPPAAGPERLVLDFQEDASEHPVEVRDGSGSENHGAFVASSLLRTTSGHNDTAALTLAAGGGFVTVPDDASLDVTNNATVEAWIFPTAFNPKGGTVVAKPGQYGLRLDASGRVEALFQTAVTGTDQWKGATAPVKLNAWSHVAASYDGLAIRIFVNGQLASSTPADTGPLSTTGSALGVGGHPADPAAVFIGTLDEVRVSAAARQGSHFPGQSPATAGQSCKTLFAEAPAAADGRYWIDPDGRNTGLAPFQIWCDMSGGGWTRVDESSHFGFGIYTEGSYVQSFRYDLSQAQIDALRAVSTEARQGWDCQGLGIGASFNVTGWNNAQAAVSAQCWAANNTSFVNGSGTHSSLSVVPLRDWRPGDCGDATEACQYNVDHAWFR